MRRGSRLIRTQCSMTTRAAIPNLRRSLHLIDVENLAGMARPSEREVDRALMRYRTAIAVGPDDHVVLATNRTTAMSAGWSWPGPLVRPASGADGADLALLAEADPDDVARRFDRVVIASGDHLFTDRVIDLRRRGVEVEVLARPGSMANSLRLAADVVRLLPDETAAVAA